MSKNSLDENYVYTDYGPIQPGVERETKVHKKDEASLLASSEQKLFGSALSIMPGNADFQKGMNFFLAEQGPEALLHFQRSSQFEYPPAYLCLCYMYKTGLGVQQDESEGKKFLLLAQQYREWFHDQAKTKNPESEFYLGLNYELAEFDSVKAVAWYAKAAASGHLGAQIFMGRYYLNGLGETVNKIKAERCYKIAAARGNIYAQIFLGKCYEHGINYGVGVDADWMKMAFYYGQAADQENAFAQLSIGCCYLEGYGVRRDEKRGVFYFKKAAVQGNVVAQVNLGRCYQIGRGIDKDVKLAVIWFKAAAAQEDAEAEVALGQCYEKGEGVVKDQEQAKSYYQKAILKKHPKAQGYLDLLEQKSEKEPGQVAQSQRGTGNSQSFIERNNHQNNLRPGLFAQKPAVELSKTAEQKEQHQENPEVPEGPVKYGKEDEAAVVWHQQKAKTGDPRSQTQLGWYYQKGVGVPRDMKRAVELYKEAVAQGYPDAQNNLGWCYQHGVGIDQDLKKAISYYRKAVHQENALAHYNLGKCYQNGTGVNQDLKNAVKYYRIAAHQGYVPAQVNLAWCYDTGMGVTIDPQKAKKWRQKASVAGNPNNLFNNRVRLPSEPPAPSRRSLCQI